MVLAGEKVVEAAGVYAGFAADGGDAGGVETLFVEELEGG
jgi:hypothetical protein